MVQIERSEPQTHGDVNPELRVAYSPASSLSPSPLTPTTGGETSVGMRADLVVESSERALRCVHFPPSHTVLGVESSSGQLTGPASSSLAREERTQTTSGTNSDYEWQINTGIP